MFRASERPQVSAVSRRSSVFESWLLSFIDTKDAEDAVKHSLPLPEDPLRGAAAHRRQVKRDLTTIDTAATRDKAGLGRPIDEPYRRRVRQPKYLPEALDVDNAECALRDVLVGEQRGHRRRRRCSADLLGGLVHPIGDGEGKRPSRFVAEACRGGRGDASPAACPRLSQTTFPHRRPSSVCTLHTLSARAQRSELTKPPLGSIKAPAYVVCLGYVRRRGGKKTPGNRRSLVWNRGRTSCPLGALCMSKRRVHNSRKTFAAARRVPRRGHAISLA
jgi:hypothetical protein